MVVIAIIFIVLIVSKLSYTFSDISWFLSDFALCINAGVSMCINAFIYYVFIFYSLASSEPRTPVPVVDLSSKFFYIFFHFIFCIYLLFPYLLRDAHTRASCCFEQQVQRQEDDECHSKGENCAHQNACP